MKFSLGINAACPTRFTSIPAETVWRQLVRAADSVSNNLVEADDASSSADFIHKIRLTLREAKESRLCLAKIRLGQLDGHERLAALEAEAAELSAIFATIARNTATRLAGESTPKTRRS